MPDTFLVFDVGLTKCKTVLFNQQGEVLARVSSPYPTYHPQPGWTEQHPQDWWQAVVTGTRHLSQQSASAMQSVRALSVTGHMHALVCLPEAPEQPCPPALVLGDQRSQPEAERLSAEVGVERIYHLTGARMDASMPAAKIAWLQKEAPEVYCKTRAFLSCKDWLRHQLTGEILTEPIDACGSAMYDIQQRLWSPELVEAAGVRPDQLPRIADPCAIAGRLSSAPARELGLPSGIPVVVGAGDDVEVLGHGLIHPGLSLVHLGSTGSILTCADRPLYDPRMAIELYPHIIPGSWVLGGSVTAAGIALGWAERVLQATEVNKKEDLTQRPDLLQPLVFIPHLAGERCPTWNPQARGSWIGLSLDHTAQDMLRAALEGVLFSLKGILERIEDLVGRQDCLLTGHAGPQQLPRVMLKADIFDRPMGVLQTHDPTALGAMLLAAVGTGVFPNLVEAVHSVAGMSKRIEPQAERVGDYQKLYAVYQAAAQAVRAINTPALWEGEGEK